MLAKAGLRHDRWQPRQAASPRTPRRPPTVPTATGAYGVDLHSGSVFISRCGWLGLSRRGQGLPAFGGFHQRGGGGVHARPDRVHIQAGVDCGCGDILNARPRQRRYAPRLAPPQTPGPRLPVAAAPDGLAAGVALALPRAAPRHGAVVPVARSRRRSPSSCPCGRMRGPQPAASMLPNDPPPPRLTTPVSILALGHDESPSRMAQSSTAEQLLTRCG